MKLEPKKIISQRYEIIELIGIGGMANVYCANDLKLDRKVTFKVLKEEFIDEEFIGRFSKEARAAARISHVNIANVYDVGNDENIYYIVMEYIDGYTLKDIIKSKAPFSSEEILGISIQIANALEVAHGNNIVHRDIKPQNILVTKEGGVKVTDFGIARATTSNTITLDNMGSAHYFSPEQARGGYIDFKSDIYSLGIIMYEMATGSLPFDGEGVVQLAMKHINDPLPSIRQINPKISESIQKIILKATEKNSDKRYMSARDLNIDLKKALSDESGDFIRSDDFSKNLSTIVISQEEIEEINNLLLDEKNKEIEDIDLDDTYKNDYNSNLNREKEIEKKVTIWAVLTALIIIGIITFFLFYWIIKGNGSRVPDFTGKTWDQAVKLAKDKEIYITNTKEEYSDIIEEGSIISQSIEPGTKINKGNNINVTLSLGTGKFELEDFVGLDISEVYKKVEDLQINLKEEYIYDEKTKIGRVVNQMPKPGKVISPEDKVTLYISKGKDKDEALVIVPNLIGFDLERAKITIKDEGLSIGRISKVESTSIEKGKVISQSINYGNEVAEGTAISLVVSEGIKEILTEKQTELTTNLPIIEDSTKEVTEITSEYIESTTVSIIKNERLIISPVLEEGVENVEVKVVKVINGQSSTIYVSQHSTSDFPLNITVAGIEPTQYELYIDGKLIGTEIKYFK